MFKRRLGRSNLEVSAMGLGCWAIGGPWDWLETNGNKVPEGWGKVDDSESIHAIRYAIDSGINFFDTAANYGCGHSERILGQAIKGQRDKVILATKFGYVVNEDNRTVTEATDVVSRIRHECEDSLHRLQTDYLDLYQFHKGNYPPEKAAEVCEVLERLVKEGKIRWYGWSTDNIEGARGFAEGPHCTAIQHRLNMIVDAPQMLTICDEYDQASINRSPLVSGMLTGKFHRDTIFPSDDIRSTWSLQDEQAAQAFQRIEAVRKMFASIGHTQTPAQIALTWVWTRSNRTLPIPGFKTMAQVKENIRAMESTLLSEQQMKKIDEVFGRASMLS